MNYAEIVAARTAPKQKRRARLVDTSGLHPIERCPACNGSGLGVTGPWGFGPCGRCEGNGLRALCDRIDPTGQDVLVLYGVRP